MKPKISVLTTGGTIAGAAARSEMITGYRAGALGADALFAACPALSDVAAIESKEVAAIDSKDMTEAIWLRLAAQIEEAFASGAAGVVITHGTDTLEETAYFLHLTMKTDKPIVLTGAMRPATALSADGPLNLLDAVRLAASPEAHGQGVLAVLNGEIHSARDIQKVHTTAVQAFASPDVGTLGRMEQGAPRFRRRVLTRHTARSEFRFENAAALPYVPILYGHAGADSRLAVAAVEGGAAGIVYAGTGDGSIHEAVRKPLLSAAEKASSSCVQAAQARAQCSPTRAAGQRRTSSRPTRCPPPRRAFSLRSRSRRRRSARRSGACSTNTEKKPVRQEARTDFIPSALPAPSPDAHEEVSSPHWNNFAQWSIIERVYSGSCAI